MTERIEVLQTLFSLPESEYKIGDRAASIKVRLAPSIALAHMLNNISRDSIVGLYLASSSGNATCSRFWSIHSPIQALRAYRALLLLRECPVLEDDTLCACYHAMQPRVSDTSYHYLESLNTSGFFNVEECRLKILDEKVNLANFEKAFLQPLRKAGVPIDLEELENEIELSNLVVNDTIRHQAILFHKNIALV